MLLALGGSVELQSVRGTRTVAADDFFVSLYQTARDEDELITAVTLPKARPLVSDSRAMASRSGVSAGMAPSAGAGLGTATIASRASGRNGAVAFQSR